MTMPAWLRSVFNRPSLFQPLRFMAVVGLAHAIDRTRTPNSIKDIVGIEQAYGGTPTWDREVIFGVDGEDREARCSDDRHYRRGSSPLRVTVPTWSVALPHEYLEWCARRAVDEALLLEMKGVTP